MYIGYSSKAPKLDSKIREATTLNLVISQSQIDPLNPKTEGKRKMKKNGYWLAVQHI